MTEQAPAETSLSIITRRLGADAVRVYLAGEIDLATAPQLRFALSDVVAATAPPAEINVDLAGVTFLDATGVGLLVRAREVARRAGVGLSVHNPRGIVMRVLDVLGLTGELRVPPAPSTSRSPRS